METSKMESTDIRQVEEMLLTQLESIAEKEDKNLLVGMLKFYFMLLEMTQKLPGLHRIKFFDSTYIVFSFLQLNGQLRRYKEQFDEEYVNDVYQMFRRLYDRL